MEVVKCQHCNEPMLSTQSACPSCGAVAGAGSTGPSLNNKELRKSALYLAAWWILIVGLSRFSLSGGSIALLALVTGFYAVRLIRLWR